MADRVERLTNLLALLLETESPLTLVQVTGELAGQYPDGEGARRAAFERDKSALRALGVPIETELVEAGPTAGSSGYWIDRRKYELAGLSLESDEMRALQVAVAAVRSNSGESRSAIWKLGGGLATDVVPVSAVVPERPELPMIRSAVATRSLLRFSYRDEPRRLDPWGLLLRGGFWYVVGYDHEREAKRTFRVDRFDGGAAAISVEDAGSFVRPTSFDPRDAFPADPKQIGHAPSDGIEAVVRVDRARAAAIERELGVDRIISRHDDGSVELRVPASNIEAFRSWLLGLLDHAVVLSPPELRTSIIDWLSGIADSTLHEAGH